MLSGKKAILQKFVRSDLRRRAILVMRELEEMAIPAIASLLGISQITVRWHLSMGRRDLTAALKTYVEDTK